MIAVLAGLVVAAAAFAVGWLLGKRTAESRANGLERRLVLLEDEAGRKYRERLASMRRRLGFVYLNGLPAATDPEVSDLFEAGARYAGQAEWDKAGERWTKALAKAAPAEVVALHHLCGICRLLLNQPDKATVEFETALAESRKAGDKAGTAASLLALGLAVVEQGATQKADGYLDDCLHMSQKLGLGELEALAAARLAELAEAQKQHDRALVFHRQALHAMQAAGDRVGAVREYGAAGEALYKQGELDKARAAHEDGLLLARQSHDRIGEAERLAAIGVINRVQGDGAHALDVMERAMRIYEELHQLKPTARLLHELALIHEQLAEPDAAQEYYERSLAVAREVGERSLQARNLEQLAEHCLSHGAFEQGLALFEDAERIDREGSRKRDLCHDLTGVGRALIRLGRAMEANKPLLEALALSRELADQKAEMWVSLYLGKSQGAAGQPVEALGSLEQTQVLARKIGQHDVLAAAVAEAAQVHAGQQDWSSAVAAAESAADLHQKLDDKLAQARDQVEVGVALRHLSRLDEAKARLDDALRLARESGNTEVEARSLFEAAAVNLALGNSSLARDNLQRSLQLREADGDLRGQAESLLGLGRLLAETGEHEAARSRLDQAARLYVKLDDRERAAEASRALSSLPGSGAGVQIIGQ
ncbi:MAG TPA: tetratricopeptide repeat protein [bacterium]|nr:tetratricopeptide repeat protein [bacterium]